MDEISIESHSIKSNLRSMTVHALGSLNHSRTMLSGISSLESHCSSLSSVLEVRSQMRGIGNSSAGRISRSQRELSDAQLSVDSWRIMSTFILALCLICASCIPLGPATGSELHFSAGCLLNGFLQLMRLEPAGPF